MAKKVVKKAARTAAANAKHAETRSKVLKLLLRAKGATQADFIEAGHNQPAATVLRIAETHGLKTRKDKPEGEVTRYYATGTPVEPSRGRKAGTKAKKAKKVAKKAKTAKKAKRAKKQSASANGASETVAAG